MCIRDSKNPLCNGYTVVLNEHNLDLSVDGWIIIDYIRNSVNQLDEMCIRDSRGTVHPQFFHTAYIFFYFVGSIE